MPKFKSRIAAATALSLLMAEAAPLAYAAGAPGDATSIDRIVTGPVPGTYLLAQNEAAPGAVEEEQQPKRNNRKAQQGEAQGQPPAQAAEQPAEAAEKPAPRNNRKAQQPAEAVEQPAEAAEKPAPRNNRKAQQPVEAAEQPAEAAEKPAPRNNRKAQQGEEQEPPVVRRAQPEQPDAGNAAQMSREERLKQRREQVRKLQGDGDAVEQPADPAPVQRAQPAEPAEPAAPAKPRPPQQARPAQPAEPAQPADQASPAETVSPPAAGGTEQAQPNESAREKRLRERREALRKLQQANPSGGAAGEAGATVEEGGVASQPGASQPPQQAGQPDIVEGAPENAAPILDSQKPRRRPGDRGNEGRPAGGRDIGQGNGTVAPPIAASPTPPPESDEDAQANAPRADDIPSVREEEGRRVADRPRRYERPEGADVLREIGSRVILELGNQVLIENNDRSRITRDARDVYYEELPRGRVRETIVRPNGVTIVTVRDRYGEIIRRSRITPDGREYVLVYVDEDRLERRGRGEWRDPGEDLPPLVIDMPYRDYVFDAERVEPNDDEAYYQFLEQPPVEKVERLYSVDEVKRSARVRDSVRRVDLDTITFDTGSAMIADGQVEKLDGVANAMLRLLEENPAETFLIEGHTDAVGSDLSNLALSDERAEAVASALTQVFNVPAENLTTQGYGEQYLKIDTDAAERENRRVAIRRITPLVAPVASAL